MSRATDVLKKISEKSSDLGDALNSANVWWEEWMEDVKLNLNYLMVHEDDISSFDPKHQVLDMFKNFERLMVGKILPEMKKIMKNL